MGDYTTDKCFRYVNNYEYCFKTFTKKRWIDRPLLAVFTQEFKAFTNHYYVPFVEL